jgi:hypothetical protein
MFRNKHPVTYGNILSYFLAGFVALALALPTAAQAQQVRISRLTDVGFGTITALETDQRLTRNVCVYSSAAAGRYSITARGSGAANAFTIASGTQTIPYEVQWAQTSGQTVGTALSTGVALAGQTSAALNSGCTVAPTRTATLIVILRGTSLASATAGTYSGVLTLVVAPN